MYKIGQVDVIKILEKENKPLSVGEIARLINCESSEVSKDLNKLLKFNEIKFIEIDRMVAYLKYGCKRRMKIYYV